MLLDCRMASITQCGRIRGQSLATCLHWSLVNLWAVMTLSPRCLDAKWCFGSGLLLKMFPKLPTQWNLCNWLWNGTKRWNPVLLELSTVFWVWIRHESITIYCMPMPCSERLNLCLEGMEESPLCVNCQLIMTRVFGCLQDWHRTICSLLITYIEVSSDLVILMTRYLAWNTI